MKKVLIFTYYWPPAGGVAVQRFLKFSKFLPEYGWEPIIITVANGSYPYYDESLLSEIDPSVRVYRTKTFEPFEFYNLLRGKKGKAMPVVSVGSQKKPSLFQRFSEYIRANYFIPDARVGWAIYAVAQAAAILQKEKIDAIITTGPPHSTHLIGLRLKEKYGLHWIADFRDPWTGIFYNQLLPRTEKTRNKDQALETQVLQTADCITVISPGMLQEFESRARKINVILNGYDESDFGSYSQDQVPAEFTIRYVGNLMASQNMEAFWKALSRLKSGYTFRLELIGRVDESVRQSIRQFGLETLTTYQDFISHAEATRRMQTAHMLLFAIPQVKDNHLILTGKLFEYLASCSEIISFGPTNGNAAAILQQTGRKPMLEFNDDNSAQQQLEEALLFYSNHHAAFKYTTDDHKAYSRKQQAGQLAALLAGS